MKKTFKYILWIITFFVIAIIAFLYILTISRPSEQPLSWTEVRVDGIRLNMPAGWEMERSPYPGDPFKGLAYASSELRRSKTKRSQMCSADSHTASITVERFPGLTYNHDGIPITILSPKDLKTYIAHRGGTIIAERTLDEAYALVAANVRLGSAPCISSQHYGWIINSEGSGWKIDLIMDEERPDIVSGVFDSIEMAEEES